jgi:hypothetical protein
VNAPPAAEPYVYTCRFCNARIPIDPLIPRPPPGIPPIVQSGTAAREARAAAAARPPPANDGKTAVRRIGWFTGLVSLLPFLIAGAVIVGPRLAGTYSSPVGKLPDAVSTSGSKLLNDVLTMSLKFPADVATNRSLEIADRDFTGDDTLVTLGTNGKLTIRRCHLKAPLIVKAGVNGEVTIIDSTLEGHSGVIEGEANLVVRIQNSTITSNEEIVDAPTNPKIYVSKDSKIHSDAVAFSLETNPEITIEHSTLEGKLGAIDFRFNGHVKLADEAVVKSDGPAIELAQNGHLTVTSSRVESATEAVRAGNNVEGTLRSSTLVGPKMALALGNNGHITMMQTTLTGPKKVGANSKIEER